MSDTMTREEVNQIAFAPSIHLNMEHEHTMSYTAIYKDHAFGICDHTPYKDGEPKGRSYRHFMVDGKVFKSKKKFYEYCETL